MEHTVARPGSKETIEGRGRNPSKTFVNQPTYKYRYFGTGESFVWRLDEESELPIIYGWVGNNNDNPDVCPQMFMAANDRLLVVRTFVLLFMRLRSFR